MRTAQDDRDVSRHQLAALVGGQGQVAVHPGETLLGFGLLQRLALILAQEGQQGPGVGGWGKDVHEGEALFQAGIALDAHQAAHQVNHQVRPAFLQGFERVQPAVSLVLGALPHHAGVHDDHVSRFGLRGVLVAQVFQGSRDPLRIGNVHLTAFSPDVVFHARYYNRSRRRVSGQFGQK